MKLAVAFVLGCWVGVVIQIVTSPSPYKKLDLHSCATWRSYRNIESSRPSDILHKVLASPTYRGSLSTYDCFCKSLTRLPEVVPFSFILLSIIIGGYSFWRLQWGHYGWGWFLLLVVSICVCAYSLSALLIRGMNVSQ